MLKYMILVGSIALFSLGTGLNDGNGPDFPFKEKWNEVEKLRNNGKPKSALEVVESIYTAAKQSKSKPNLLRSIIVRNTLSMSLEEMEYATLLQRMEQEILTTADNEVKALLQSATASMYAEYVVRNSYRLRDRIDIGELSTDINLWSIKDIQQRADSLMLLSLDLTDLDDITLDGFEFDNESQFKIKPINLKPYLTQQGVYHFKNDLTSMSSVKDPSSLPQSLGLLPVKQFIKEKLNTELRTQARTDNSIILYQKLLSYYKGQPLIQAKIDINRLNYAESKYLTQKQSLADLQSEYYRALRQGMKDAKEKNQEAVYGITLAQKYVSLSSQYQTDFDKGYSDLVIEAMEMVDQLNPDDGNLKEVIEGFKLSTEQSTLNLMLDEVILPSRSLPFKLNVKNVAEVKLSLHRLTPLEYRDAKTNLYKDDYSKVLQKKPQVTQWTEVLDTPKDYLNHSTELIMPQLTLGHYVIFVEGKSSASSKYNDNEKFTIFQVSNQEIVKWPTQQGNVIQLVDLLNGSPIAGANIEISGRQRNNRNDERVKLLDLTTDEDGKALIKELKNNHGMSLISTVDNDILVADLHFQRTYNGRQSRSQPHVFMDRSIYRPGQMVHGKLVHLTYDENRTPSILKNTDIKIRLRDANNQEVSTQSVKTNDYGVAVFSTTLPSDGLKGSYRLYFDHNEGSTSTQIKVEEYRRPTLESELDPIIGTYVLGDAVKVTGSVKTLSGFASQGAKVSYTISESPYYDWYRCAWSCWWYPPYQNQSQVIATGTTVSDKDGMYQIKFETDDVALRQRQKGKQYKIDVVITDQSGETLTSSKSVFVTKDHFRIDHSLPSLINLEDESKLSPTIQGLNLDGQAVEVESKITIQRMETYPDFAPVREYQLDYLHYTESEFDEKNTLYRYPNTGGEEVIDSEFMVVTTDLVELETKLYQLAPGDYKLTIKGTSNKGDQAESTHRVLIYDKQKESPHLLLYTESQSVTAEVGTNLTLPLLIHNEVSQVYYKKIRGNTILEEGWLSRTELLKKKFNISKSDMGGFTLDVSCNIKGERSKVSITVSVPYVDTDIDLNLDLDSLLLPATPYQLGVTALCDGKPLADANMTFVMYDAALDRLYPHQWKREFYPTFYSQVHEQSLSRANANIRATNRNRRNYRSNAYLDLHLIPKASWYGIIYTNGQNWNRGGRANGGFNSKSMSRSGAPQPTMMESASDEMSNQSVSEEKSMAFDTDDTMQTSAAPIKQTPPPVRSDFGETVFFDSDGMTDKKGQYTLDFETNDAITQWKILAFVHDREMRYGFAEMTTQTNKPVQIIQMPTRTLSEGDKVRWPITVQNSSETQSSGTASIKVLSYLTQEDVTDQFINNGKSHSLTIAAGKAQTIFFDLHVPSDYKDRVEVITQYLSDEGSDAESRNLPVYTTDKYLTSGDPLWVQPGKKSTLNITAPDEAKTETLTLEIATNPFWMVARSFPMLAERDAKITTSLSDHVVVESIGQQILQDYPEIERVMSSNALQSEGTPLNRNEDLKIQELNSTPWVRQAKQAETRVADFAKYFNKNNSTQRLKSATSQLWKRQNGDGGWPWIAGGRSSLYTSMRVLIDLAQIQEMGVSTELTSDQQRLQRALNYTDKEIQKIKNRSTYKNGLPMLFITDLYLYSLLPDEYKRPSYHSDWLKQLEKQWIDLSLPYQALAGKIFIKNGKTEAAQNIKESLLERAITRKDGTVFWREINEYYSYYNSYAAQVSVLDFLSKAGVTGDVIDRGSQWLIANKRSNEWYDERGTAAVVYYLYQQYGAKIDDGEGVSISINGTPQELERSLTYSSLELSPSDYESDLKIEVNNSEDYPVFGGVYRQFFQPIDKVTRHPAAQNLSIKKTIYVKKTNGTEVTYIPAIEGDVRVGDELKVRLEIEVFDRLSYVYVTDARPSGTEPVNQLSGYDYRNGLYSYQSPNDKGQEFFIEVMPKGTHTLEYSTRVLHAGDFTSGVAEIQSFYVPEFSAYDSYGRVETLPLSLDSND